MNRIYFNAPTETRLVLGGETVRIHKGGFADTVVWNPGAKRCAGIPDLEPDDYQRFVCVEAAAVGMPVRLKPGEHWQGWQLLEV